MHTNRNAASQIHAFLNERTSWALPWARWPTWVVSTWPVGLATIALEVGSRLGWRKWLARCHSPSHTHSVMKSTPARCAACIDASLLLIHPPALSPAAFSIFLPCRAKSCYVTNWATAATLYCLLRSSVLFQRSSAAWPYSTLCRCNNWRCRQFSNWLL